MSKLWQLYNETGKLLKGQAADWQEVLSQGLLHAAAHVWLWRRNHDSIEVLVQKRAHSKVTYPGKLDISAAGHVDKDETELQAAVREVREELGFAVKPEQLEFIHTLHRQRPAGSGRVENEWKFVYLCRITGEPAFQVQTDEVASLEWCSLEQLTQDFTAEPAAGKYVYQGDGYFEALLAALASK